jgi:predicted peptidase
MRNLYCLLAMQLIVIGLYGQKTNEYAAGYFVQGKDTLPYRYLQPLNFKAGKKYPVIIVLHGTGERGTDNKLQLVHGAKEFMDPLSRKNFPAYIIFPQCKPNTSWARVTKQRFSFDSLGGFEYLSQRPLTRPSALLLELLDSIYRQPSVNKDKIYLGGLSMGGMGTFELLWRKPGFFAAAFAICGGGDPQKVGLYKEVPIWIFHGKEDPVVPVANSRRMFRAIRNAGGTAKYYEYRNVGHHSWDNALAEPGLLPWLFSQSRKKL